MIALIVIMTIVLLAAAATLVDVSRDGYGRRDVTRDAYRRMPSRYAH
jgi:hypothetical protein